MSEKIGVAVIGCGHWGKNYVRIFSALPDTEMLAVCDTSEERLSAIQQSFPKVAITSDLDEVLARDDVDAIVVSTHATSHYEVTRPAIEAGKHILVEKPLTVEVSESEELIRLAKERGVVLMVGHIFLFNNGIRKVKEYVEQGDFGQLYYLYARRTNLGPIRQDVNAFWDLATHDVSIFNYLLGGMPEWVSAVGTRILQDCCEDAGFAVLSYPNGVVGHIHVSWAEPNKVRELVAVGSKQRIAFDDLNAQELVRIYEKGVASHTIESSGFGEFRLSVRDGDIISPHIEYGEPLKNQVIHFVECVKNGQHPISDGQNGLDVVRVMSAIEESVAGNGSPITL